MRHVWFGADRPNYETLLAQLESLTNLRAQNLALMIGAPYKLEERAESFSVRLDREAWVPGATLVPGLYQVMLVRLPGESGEVYFFRDKKRSSRTAQVALIVEICQPNRTGRIPEDYL